MDKKVEEMDENELIKFVVDCLMDDDFSVSSFQKLHLYALQTLSEKGLQLLDDAINFEIREVVNNS